MNGRDIQRLELVLEASREFSMVLDELSSLEDSPNEIDHAYAVLKDSLAELDNAITALSLMHS